MSDVIIRIEGRAGRITLNRPDALGALTHPMAMQIEAALDDWRTDDLACIIIDSIGDRAFCAGGDIADMYASGQRKDYAFGRQFWRDEYRLNAKIAEYPTPIFTFLKGFTMGGGVGLGCHASHRIVDETSKIAMPEVSIGLVPDVGGSLLLAQAPGHLGEYVGLTATRMNAADAIYMGFADHFIPSAGHDALIARLIAGELILTRHDPGVSPLAEQQAFIDGFFGLETLSEIALTLTAADTDQAYDILSTIDRNAPLAMACALQIIRQVRANPTIRYALEQEFLYTSRAVQQGDFIEGIRAAIIDKDRKPAWTYKGRYDVPEADIAAMLQPGSDNTLHWEDHT